MGTAPITYSWNWGDGNFSSGTNPSHTYNAAGVNNICLTITDATGCIDTYCDSSYLYRTGSSSTMITVTVINSTTGISEILSGSSLSIYPNPSTTKLTINATQTQNITITNTLGQTVMDKKLSPNAKGEMELDISFLPHGIYFLKAGDVVKKFVKE